MGSTTALSALTTDAPGTTQLGGTLRTTGAQTFGDAVTLTNATTLTGSDVAFGNTVDGGSALQVNASGATTFAANVGSGTALLSLSTDAPGTTTLPARVTTTATQTFGDTVVLAAPATNLSASGIALRRQPRGRHLEPDDAQRCVDAGRQRHRNRLARLRHDRRRRHDRRGRRARHAAARHRPARQVRQLLGADGGPRRWHGRHHRRRHDAVGPDDLHRGHRTGHVQLARWSAAVRRSASPAAGATTVAGTLAGLASFTVPNTVRFDGGSVATSGAQTYGGAITLPGNGTLTAGSAQFGAAIDGPGVITVTTTGGSVFTGPVGSTTALAAVTVNGPVQLNTGCGHDDRRADLHGRADARRADHLHRIRRVLRRHGRRRADRLDPGRQRELRCRGRRGHAADQPDDERRRTARGQRHDHRRAVLRPARSP